MDQGAVQPLDVVAVREREQDLVADDGEGQEKHGPCGDCERERAQEQPGREERNRHQQLGKPGMCG